MQFHGSFICHINTTFFPSVTDPDPDGMDLVTIKSTFRSLIMTRISLAYSLTETSQNIESLHVTRLDTIRGGSMISGKGVICLKVCVGVVALLILSSFS